MGVTDDLSRRSVRSLAAVGKGDKAVAVQMLDGPAGAGRLTALKTLAAEALVRLQG